MVASPLRATRTKAVSTLYAFRLIAKRRLNALDEQIETIVASMAKRQVEVAANTISSVVADGHEAQPKRVVERALGKWRGSTVAGYMRSGDAQTYRLKFRCTKAQFDTLYRLLIGSCFDTCFDKQTVTHHADENGRCACKGASRATEL